MFDFHLHLARLPHPEQTGKALLQGDYGFNNVACEPWEWEKSLEIRKIFVNPGNVGGVSGSPDAYSFAFGVHPMAAAQVSPADLNRLEQILRSGKYAVGECGLDKRFEGYEPAGIQEQVLLKQIEWAQELNRPLQVHCVGDYFRILKIIEGVDHASEDKCSAEGKCAAAPLPQVIFHRFGGDAGFVKATLKQLGERAIFSLHADSFRKKSTAAAIKLMPAAQIRFETDADESFIAEDCEVAAEVIKRLGTLQKKYDELQPEAPTFECYQKP